MQNDWMALPLIVHALFVQQMHTHSAFTECLIQFQCMLSGYLLPGIACAYTPSPRCPVPRSQPLSTTCPTQAPLDGKICTLYDDALDYKTVSFWSQALKQEMKRSSR